MTAITMDGLMPRELTTEELALVAGGGLWQNLLGGVEHLGKDVEKGLVAGAVTGAVGGALADGVGAAPGAVAGSVVGAVGGALKFLNI